MKCLSCGNEALVGRELCERCADAAKLDAKKKRKRRLKYTEFAGFWLRVFAYITDAALIWLPSVAAGWYLAGIPYLDAGNGKGPMTAVLPLVLVPVYARLFSYIFILCYFPLFESSALQATLGKKLFGLVVVSTSGKRLSIGRAFLRNFARFAPAIPVALLSLIGIVLILFQEITVGVFSIFAGMGLGALIYAVQYLLVAFTPTKQGLHDLVARSYVVRDKNFPFSSYCLRAFVAVAVLLTCSAATTRPDRLSSVDAIELVTQLQEQVISRLRETTYSLSDAIAIPSQPLTRVGFRLDEEIDFPGGTMKIVKKEEESRVLLSLLTIRLPASATFLTEFRIFNANRELIATVTGDCQIFDQVDSKTAVTLAKEIGAFPSREVRGGMSVSLAFKNCEKALAEQSEPAEIAAATSTPAPLAQK